MLSTRCRFTLPFVFASLIGGSAACQDDDARDGADGRVDDATMADTRAVGDVRDATVASDARDLEDGVSDILPDGSDNDVLVRDALDDLGETRGEDATDATGPEDLGEPETGEFDGFPEVLDDLGLPIETLDEDTDFAGDAVSSFDTGWLDPDALDPRPDF